MTARTDNISAALDCHRCGYDLRAHPEDGRCPECGESIAESRRFAAIPRRPAWRDSDPRWRRRLLAGAWILVLLPLMDVLQKLEWASSVRVPTVFDYRGTVRTINDTFLSWLGVFKSLVFCIGVVLLFSKERGRHPARLDWTRRWGILGSYVVLLLSAAQILILPALILAGIAASFQAMPLKWQPDVTPFFVHVSTAYLRYGPFPRNISYAVLVVFSSVVMLLACIPLFDALRSSGPKRLAAVLLAPLASFALMHLVQAVGYCLSSNGASEDVLRYGVYFWPELLVGNDHGLPGLLTLSGSVRAAFYVEAVKWCAVLSIAVWLTVARVAAWRHNRGTGEASSAVWAGRV